MAKQKDITELVWAEKDGYERRQFTRQQLNAMGEDPGGKSHDGWKVVDEAKEPKEVTAAKAKADKEKAAAEAKAKAEQEATKNDTDNGTQTVATETSTDAGSKNSNQ